MPCVRRGDPDEEFPDVLAAARAGDSAAYGRLYHAHAGEIVAFAAARGARDPDAVANDTYLRAFRGLERFDGDAADFRSWVFAIARNVVIDAHRHESRRPPVADGSRHRDRAGAPSAEAAALTAMGAERVEEVLSVLTDDQREVIALRLVADLTIAEVSRILDKPETSVKALQRRAMRRLQREILREVVS